MSNALKWAHNITQNKQFQKHYRSSMHLVQFLLTLKKRRSNTWHKTETKHDTKLKRNRNREITPTVDIVTQTHQPSFNFLLPLLAWCYSTIYSHFHSWLPLLIFITIPIQAHSVPLLSILFIHVSYWNSTTFK